MITQTEAAIAESSFFFQRIHAFGSKIAGLMSELALTQPATVLMCEDAYRAGFRDAIEFANNKNQSQGQITG